MENIKSKNYYEKLFAPYPDVVRLPQFCEMMGGIAESTARKILKSGVVKGFLVNTTYHIPKVYILEYVMSDAYRSYKSQLKHRI
jgi:hypothetical protein